MKVPISHLGLLLLHLYFHFNIHESLWLLSYAIVNFTIDDIFILASCMITFFKMRNLIITDRMVQKWQKMAKNSHSPAIGIFYNCTRKIGLIGLCHQFHVSNLLLQFQNFSYRNIISIFVQKVIFAPFYHN